LIDEYLSIVTPVVAGEGKLLFKHVKQFGLTLYLVYSTIEILTQLQNALIIEKER
jgi:hypothetical protein